jgi:hypothetical protein
VVVTRKGFDMIDLKNGGLASNDVRMEMFMKEKEIEVTPSCGCVYCDLEVCTSEKHIGEKESP